MSADQTSNLPLRQMVVADIPALTRALGASDADVSEAEARVASMSPEQRCEPVKYWMVRLPEGDPEAAE